MKQPELKTTKTGSKTLIVYYSGDAYGQVIDNAEWQLGLAGEKLAVLAL